MREYDEFKKELDTLQNKNKLLPMQTLLNKLNTDPYYKVSEYIMVIRQI